MSSRLRPAVAPLWSSLQRQSRRYGPKRVSKKSVEPIENVPVLSEPVASSSSSLVAQANAQDSSVTTLRAPEARLRPPRQLLKAAVTPPNRPGRLYPPVPQPESKTTMALCYATAVKYSFENLLPVLGRLGLIGSGNPGDALNLLGEVIYLPQWPPQAENAGEAFIFENGAFVTWGVTQENADALMATLIRPTSKRADDQLGVEFEGYHTPETDELSYEVMEEVGSSSLRGTDIELRPTASSSSDSSALFNTPILSRLGLEARPREEHFEATSEVPLLLPHMPEAGKQPLPRGLDDILVRLAFSAALVRSTKLACHEQDLERKLMRVTRLPRWMILGDEEAVGSRRDALQLYGTAMFGRHQITLAEQNILDPPEMFWQAREPILEKHYSDLCEALDFHRRLDIQNTRLDYTYDLATVMLQLAQAKAQAEANLRMHRMQRYVLALVMSGLAYALYLNWHKLPQLRQPGAKQHGGVYAAPSTLGEDRFPEQGPELRPVPTTDETE